MPKFAANLSTLFGELPFPERFAAAKAAGFSGVEYLFPYDFEKAVLREQLRQYALMEPEQPSRAIVEDASSIHLETNDE